MTLLSQFHQASLVLSENISLDLGKNEPMWVPATTRLRVKKTPWWGGLFSGGVRCLASLLFLQSWKPKLVHLLTTFQNLLGLPLELFPDFIVELSGSK